MESEKVKEIKELLEEEIILGEAHNKGLIVVEFDLIKNALTLINELEKENAELKKYKFDWLNGEKMHLQADMEETEFELYCANKAFKKVREENQQLKDQIAELEKENARLLDSVETVQSNRCTTKCELTKKALKQFAERLKEKCEYNRKEYCCEATVSYNDIDETLKECVE